MYIVEDEFHFSLCALLLMPSGNYTLNQNGKNAITTKQTFYNIMSSDAKSDILSVAKYLLSSFSLRKEILQIV